METESSQLQVQQRKRSTADFSLSSFEAINDFVNRPEKLHTVVQRSKLPFKTDPWLPIAPQHVAQIYRHIPEKERTFLLDKPMYPIAVYQSKLLMLCFDIPKSTVTHSFSVIASLLCLIDYLKHYDLSISRAQKYAKVLYNMCKDKNVRREEALHVFNFALSKKNNGEDFERITPTMAQADILKILEQSKWDARVPMLEMIDARPTTEDILMAVNDNVNAFIEKRRKEMRCTVNKLKHGEYTAEERVLKLCCETRSFNFDVTHEFIQRLEYAALSLITDRVIPRIYWLFFATPPAEIQSSFVSPQTKNDIAQSRAFYVEQRYEMNPNEIMTLDKPTVKCSTEELLAFYNWLFGDLGSYDGIEELINVGYSDPKPTTTMDEG